MPEQKTIAATLGEIVERFCNDYCRYPREFDEKAEGMELCESEHCANCPTNLLI